MYKTYIKTSGATLLYESDIDLTNFFIKNAKYMDFPGLELINENEYDSNNKVIYHNNTIESIKCIDDCIEIYYPFSELTEASIAYMGYILMEKQRAQKNMVTVHSACVQKDDNGILLLGRAGSGKTTTAVDLCTKYDFELIGNDRNIIGLDNNAIKVYDGTKFLFLRYESVIRNLPHLIKYFSNDEEDTWLNKVKILPEVVDIKTCDTPTNIIKSYIVHVDNTKNDLNVLSGDTAANRLYLNEILSMYIRGIYTTFSDKNFRAKGYIPSYDSVDFYRSRANIIEKIIEDCNLDYISGNVNNVTEYINEKHKQLILK